VEEYTYRIKLPETSPVQKVNYEELLNEEQLRVVKSEPGPAIVVAGAGSGKTRVITYRVAYLLNDLKMRERIILLTFTNKAAREMLSRVGGIFPSYYQIVWGGTFHHIAVRYLRQFAEKLGFKSNFAILDNEDSKELIDLSMDELSIKRDSFVQSNVLLDIYGLTINTLKSVEDIIFEKRPYLTRYVEEISRIFIRYNQKKESSNLMDFDDILKYFYILLSQNQDVKKEIVNEIGYVLVDEFQDTSPIQAEISYLLASRDNHIMVVGDDAQSIYSFRGASIDNMLEFPKRFKDAQIFHLNSNYRSTKNILSIAQDVISNNVEQFKKNLKPVRKDGERPWLVSAADVREEARFVVARIAELINDGHKPSEIAVLYRAHSHSMELQMELTKANIPFVIRSGLRFFEQAHIKDVTSFLRVIYNPEDEISFRRVMKMFGGIGNTTANILRDSFVSSKMNLFEWAKRDKMELKGRAKAGFEEFKRILNKVESLPEQKPVEILHIFNREFYSDFIKNHYTDAIERLVDIEFFLDFVSRYNTLLELFSELALISNMEIEKNTAVERDKEDYIILSTVHQAKGLEFQTVFVIGLCEGMFPSLFASNRLKDLEEERRLFYVAITRAKDNLYLTYPNSVIKEDNTLSIKKRSRFLDEIENIKRKLKLVRIKYEKEE
jgi:DNA helicase-2/ATP-dependent DNA helicase PcrA